MGLKMHCLLNDFDSAAGCCGDKHEAKENPLVFIVNIPDGATNALNKV